MTEPFMRVPARLLLPSLVVLLAYHGLNATAADGTPPWQRGISTWNGSGYTYPPSSQNITTRDSPATSQPPVVHPASNPVDSATPRYITPVDPSAPSQPITAKPVSSGELVWLESLSAAEANHPIPATVNDAPDPPDARVADRGAIPLPQPLPILEGPRHDGPLNDGRIDRGALSGEREPSLTEQLDTSEFDDAELPLEEEVTRWYHYPWTWIRSGWDNHAEFGLDGSDGNATTLALTTGLELKRKSDQHTFAVDLDYRHATTGGATTQDSGRFNTDYDRLLGDTPWSAFSKFGLEWDRFKAFDLRLNTNAGFGYHWIRTDDAALVTRFGAGASKEFGSPDDDWVPEAVFGIDAERQLNKRHKLKGKIDYFPAWTNFNDYRIVADAAWEILLTDSDNLSLKLSVTDRYDSTPQGAKPNDFYYSMLLLYKF